jgi:hypothetical protein
VEGPAEEIVFVVDVSSFSGKGFVGTSSFSGDPVAIEFDDGSQGVFLSREMARKLGVKKGSRISALVEAEKTDEGKPAEAPPGPPPISEAERAEAMGFLLRVDLLDQVVRDAFALGVVGEAINIKILFLIAISRLQDDPLSAIVLSQSGAGKSGLAELLARLAEMAGLEILLARVERGLTLRRKLLGPVWGLDNQRPQSFVLRIDWQQRQDLVLRWQSDLRGPDLYRRLGRVFTTGKAEKNPGSNEKPTYRFLCAISHGCIFWTDWTDDRHCPPQW